MQLSQVATPLRSPKAGDILGFSGYNGVSYFINAVTYGIPGFSVSHVGILGEYNGELLLFESTTLDDFPCIIQGKPFRGAQAVRLSDRLGSYGGKVWHYPLYRTLYAEENKRLSEYLISKIGTPYDSIGAFRSGGLGFSWLESKLREPDLSALFCSEWVASAHREIGILQTDNESKWNPNSLVRYERRKGLLLKPRRVR